MAIKLIDLRKSGLARVGQKFKILEIKKPKNAFNDMDEEYIIIKVNANSSRVCAERVANPNRAYWMTNDMNDVILERIKDDD